jgi:serine/threonine protein kinase
MPSTPQVFAGRYQASVELNRGGMGRILRARDLKLDREVALKLLVPGAHDEQQRLRFEQEARAAGSLNHPNILAVHDAGEQEGEPFIVTELLEGETLRSVLSRGPLAPARALELAIQLAEGLAAAHGAGILHRDIKPENLFLTRQGHLKILDFGIAKLLEGTKAPGALHTAWAHRSCSRDSRQRRSAPSAARPARDCVSLARPWPSMTWAIPRSRGGLSTS